jgi:hypothetical protein
MATKVAKKSAGKTGKEIAFTSDNPSNVKKAISSYKNVLICGVKGVGKITNTIPALEHNTNVYYLSNPVDYEGKLRPGSCGKYLEYIRSLKTDLKVVTDITKLFKIKSNIILIIDEIYGRREKQLEQISAILDMNNIKVIQIVGCMKYMGSLIDKMDIIVELHHDGAFIIDKDLARAICSILGKK